ncbi:sensor histidine kinase [Chitinophaga niabensis]|uniref:Histidine kinase n=1 Tax=Chitinophaga niabensis TaxID=536979 RepID=A0A1N6GNM8_9BACT|nr:histidine kinase [Chitinophaga niabensis]SIO09085.1 Histidine kinase [Chitinophaga niabensis]
MAQKNILNNSWVVNTLFLIVLLTVMVLVNMQYEPINNVRLYLNNGVSVIFIYVMCAVHNKYMLNMLIMKRLYWQYLGLLVGWLAFTTWGSYTLRVNIFRTDMDMIWVSDLVFSLACLLIGIGLWFLYRQATWHTLELRNSLLMRDKEIQYLQSQLNPHFFFNTLNNLYGVSLRYPNKTPELILSISELLRYQLQSSRKQLVPLEDELQFVRNYVHLERARVRQRCQVSFKKKGSEKDLLITPLILITFVENAFKYAPSSIQASYIKVELEIKGETLLLKIRNTVPENKQSVSSTGVGLNNVKQRLALAYAKRHTLVTHEENNIYYTELLLTLERHASTPLPDRR